MRIKILQRPPTKSIDGVQLDRFETGFQYEVGSALGCLFLAEGWAEPVGIEEPGLVVPFSMIDGFAPEIESTPPNLIREVFPPSLSPERILAVDFERRKRPRNR
jgi:hypothetical protein